MMQKITPFLWFNDQAEEAINFYVSIFKNSKMVNANRDPDGKLFTATFQLEGHELNKKLETAQAVLDSEKIRWVIGKRTPFLEDGNMYGEIFTEHEFNRAIDMIIVEETEVQEILGKLKEGAQSVKDLAKALAIPTERVFRYITALKRKDMVALENVSGRTPIFQLVSQEV